MNKFDNLVNEVKNNLNTETIDETWFGDALRWTGRQAMAAPGAIVQAARSTQSFVGNAFATGDQQGKYESRQHYENRMIAKGYFDKAWSRYKTYETGNNIYFVLANYDLNYKNLKNSLGSKFEKSPTTTSDKNLIPTFLNFAGMDSNPSPDNQPKSTASCATNLRAVSHLTSRNNDPSFGSTNKITSSKTYDTINKTKLLEYVATELINPETKPIEPEPTPEGPLPESLTLDEATIFGKQSGYPEIYRVLLDIEDAVNKGQNNIWFRDRNNYLENAKAMIDKGIGDVVAAIIGQSSATPSSGRKTRGSRISTGGSNNIDSLEQKVNECIQKLQGKPLHGLWKDSSYLAIFVRTAFSSTASVSDGSGGTLLNEKGFITRLQQDYQTALNSKDPDKIENFLYDAFGIPPYPFRSDGIYNFYKTVLNEIPKTLTSEGFTNAQDDIYFVPQDAYDSAMQKSRLGSILKQWTGAIIKKGFVKGFNEIKNALTNSRYNFENIKTYDGG